MRIDSKGWVNLETRSNIPDQVYVEQGRVAGIKTYDYSESAPAMLDSLFGGHAKENFLNLFYTLPEIFAPVNEIASRVADCNWVLKKTYDDSIDYKDKDFNRLFTNPNPLMSFKQFVWQAVVYEILTGANFNFFNKPSALADDYKNIVTWMNLPAHQVCIKKKKGVDIYTATSLSDFISQYTVPQEGYIRTFETRQVLPIMSLDVKSGNQIDKYRSPLEGAKLAIKNLIPVYEARGIIYIKRGALGFVVSKLQDADGIKAMTPTQKKDVQNDFQNLYGLTGNKNLVSVSSVPVDFVRTSLSIQELQPFDETLADAVAIYKVLRVPRHLVPSKDTSTYANADSDIKSFYGDVIIPAAKRLAEAWTNYMKIPGRYIDCDFSHISALQDNMREKAFINKTNTETAVLQYKEGIITKNERNAMVGAESVLEGNTYSSDGKNKDPLAVKLGVGALQAMQNILIDTTLSDEAKKNALVVVFGMDETDAVKLVISKPIENVTQPNTTGTP